MAARKKTTARKSSSKKSASKKSASRKSAAKKKSSRSSSAGMDAITLLRTDHRNVQEMFDQFEKTRSGDRKKALAEKICMELTVHAQIEEEIFYPAAREAVRSGEELLDEAEVEHGSIKELVSAIENASPDDDELFEARVKVLGEYVKHHVKEEENHLFPKIRKSDMDLEEVGAQLSARKKELMRTLKGDA